MKRIRDPIHVDIRVEPVALEVIDTPKFQRLRRVHQLGTANLVYPGANHTRFEHSLGAYHLASRVTSALDLPRGDALHVRLAALLHDIGHGPYSHTTDYIMKDYLGKGHADFSREAVQMGTLREILERHGADPARVGATLTGEGPLSAIVASDLDVDRMDYIVRDAHYTGLTTSVDLSRIVNGLRLAPGGGIALDESALLAAESLLVARFMMYSSVYYHHTCRVAEVMIDRAIRLAIDATEIEARQLPTMDDAALFYLLRHSKTDAQRLAKLVDQRKLYKTALEAGHGALAEARIDALRKDKAARREAERAIAERAGASAHEVMIDVPPLSIEEDVDIAIMGEDGALQSLSHRSTLVASLARAQRDHWRLRVIAPSALREKAESAAREVLLSS